MHVRMWGRTGLSYVLLRGIIRICWRYLLHQLRSRKGSRSLAEPRAGRPGNGQAGLAGRPWVVERVERAGEGARGL